MLLLFKLDLLQIKCILFIERYIIQVYIYRFPEGDMMGSRDTISAQENRSSPEPNNPRAVENHNSRQENSSSRSVGDTAGADRRYERGLEVYASQFQISREEVAPWFAEHVGGRFGEEAILS